MLDLSAIVQAGAAQAWFYLPIAVVLGALHALEPGHAKSLMAGYIIAIRGTSAQAALLGLSAAAGHTMVVWALALAGLFLGCKYIGAGAEPWFMLVSGLLVMALALRMIWMIAGRAARQHAHGHGHGHGHGHDHDHHHHHAPAAASSASPAQIVWFGVSGGLMPCPAAIAVLLVCLQVKAFALGLAMVAAFSIGLAATLVAIGLAVAWGAVRLGRLWPGFERWAGYLPFLSAGFILLLGVASATLGILAIMEPGRIAL